MKHFNLLLLGGALFIAAPLRADLAQMDLGNTFNGQTLAQAAPNWNHAQANWKLVQELTAELDELIANRQLAKVHDAALNLRDAVRDVRLGWHDLEPQKRSAVDDSIRRLDGLLDALHESADHNDLRTVVKEQRTLHVLLDGIAGAFPTNVMTPIGPVVAKGEVKDPFCRMMVDPATAAAKAVYNGQTYYFCATSEASDFKKNPARYAALYDELNFGKPKRFTVDVSSPRIQTGQPATLAFAIREAGKSALVNKFQLVHDKYFHLIMVSDDLSWFAHEHPQIARDGRFYLKWTFPRAGRYWLYSDFTPAIGSNTVARSEVRVEGTTSIASKPRLVPDRSFTKTVNGYQVKVKVAPSLQAGKQSLLTYTITKNNQPVTNLQPYLAAMGHLMAIHQNGRDVVHTHAVSPGSDHVTGLEVTPEMASASGPNITYKLQLPSGGFYRIWAQFQHKGQVLTVPFTFSVKPKSNEILQTKTVVAHTVKQPAKLAAPSSLQKVFVALPDGYKNGIAKVQAGRPVALTFHLTKPAGCGSDVMVPAASWKKSLKVGEKATVTFTPKKSGPLAFACTMNHMKGTLLVR